MAHAFNRAEFEKYKTLAKLSSGLLRTALVTRGMGKALVSNGVLTLSQIDTTTKQAYQDIDAYLTSIGY